MLRYGLPIHEQDVQVISKSGTVARDGHVLLRVEVIINARGELTKIDAVFINIHHCAGEVHALALIIP